MAEPKEPVAPVKPEIDNERLSLSIRHTDVDGKVLSDLSLTYPTLNNALANRLQLDIVNALVRVIEPYAREKAQALGQPWLEPK